MPISWSLRVIWGRIYPLHRRHQNLFKLNIHLREAQFENWRIYLFWYKNRILMYTALRRQKNWCWIFFRHLNIQFFGKFWYPRKRSYIEVEFCERRIVNVTVNMAEQLRVLPSSEKKPLPQKKRIVKIDFWPSFLMMRCTIKDA